MINKSENVADLLAALSKFQASVTGAKKGGTNPHFRSNYTRLEDAWAAAREHLGANGLSVYQAPMGRNPEGSRVGVTTLLGHESGQWMESTCVVGLDERQNGAQADGSAITYACRYAFLAALGLAPTDDDGNATVGQQQPANTNGAAPNVQAVSDQVANTEKINRMAAEAAKALTPPAGEAPSLGGGRMAQAVPKFSDYGSDAGRSLLDVGRATIEAVIADMSKERNLNDPKWGKVNAERLANAKAVLAWQILGGDEPPPPTDADDPGEPDDQSDIPF